MAESFLTTGAAARTGGDRYQVMLNFDAEVLTFGADGACEIDGGPPLDPETARRLACDCALVVSERGSAGEVLNVGRKTRSVPPAIRRALRARDKTCRFPGCDEARWLDGHHGRHYAHGGETSLANLVHLCWHHHWLVHEGGWTLEILTDGDIAVYQPNGQPLGAPATLELRPDGPRHHRTQPRARHTHQPHDGGIPMDRRPARPRPGDRRTPQPRPTRFRRLRAGVGPNCTRPESLRGAAAVTMG